jgi:hypothetical protein
MSPLRRTREIGLAIARLARAANTASSSALQPIAAEARRDHHREFDSIRTIREKTNEAIFHEIPLERVRNFSIVAHIDQYVFFLFLRSSSSFFFFIFLISFVSSKTIALFIRYTFL